MNSNPVGAKTTAAKAAYDNLRTDMLDHIHDGDTDKITHSNLVSVGSNTHSQVDTHISSAGNVHGASATEYVLKCKGAQQLVRKGRVSLNAVAVRPDWTGYVDVYYRGDQAAAFNGVPTVLIDILDDNWGQVVALRWIVTGITTTKFRVYLYAFADASGLWRCPGICGKTFTSNTADGYCPTILYYGDVDGDGEEDDPVYCYNPGGGQDRSILYWTSTNISLRLNWTAIGDRYT